MPSRKEVADLVRHQRNIKIDNILLTLHHLAYTEQSAGNRHAKAKAALDAYIKEIMELPATERPTGDEMAEVVSLDRRRLYQIRDETTQKERGHAG